MEIGNYEIVTTFDSNLEMINRFDRLTGTSQKDIRSITIREVFNLDFVLSVMHNYKILGGISSGQQGMFIQYHPLPVIKIIDLYFKILPSKFKAIPYMSNI